MFRIRSSPKNAPPPLTTHYRAWGHGRWLSAAHGLFVLLAVLQVVRTLRHPMWRDELQAHMIAAGSPTLIDLFTNLTYEGHPGLWHLLLWVVTRFSTDPLWMQVAHIVVALGTWCLIYCCAPFSTVNKFLLLGSFYLSWQYFVISRSYGLMALLGFGYIALRAHRPQQALLQWLVLGLLANTVVFGTIWSIALGAFAFARDRWRNPAFLGGVALYGSLLALAVITMARSADQSIYSSTPHLSFNRLDQIVAYPIGAFLPTFTRGITELVRSNGLWIVIIVLPVAACWAVTRDRLGTAAFSLAYVGVLVFAQLWRFPGGYQHHGMIFLAFVGAVWLSRLAPSARSQGAWLLAAILLVNAAAGLRSLGYDRRPYSQGHAVAEWVRQNRLDHALILGARDPAVSTVAGYLRRPLYYLYCECQGTYVRWTTWHRQRLDDDELLRRAARALHAADRDSAILILNGELAAPSNETAAGLALEPAARFTGAVIPDENFFVYRMRLK